MCNEIGLKVVRIGKWSVMGEERCDCDFEECYFISKNKEGVLEFLLRL
jgi:hypothetical protein